MFRRSWQRFRQTAQTDWSWLVLEFAAVVVGVTLSFALQDWRETRAADREQIRLLQALRDDLLVDVAFLEKDAELLEILVASHRRVLDDRIRAESTPAELDAAMDQIITYKGFAPNNTTWRTMEATGGFSLVNSDELLAQIVGLYEQGYPSLLEWAHINREFVLHQMIPYVNEHAPVIEISDDPFSIEGMHLALPSLLIRSHYQNLVRTGRLYKAAQRDVVIMLRDSVQEVANAIDAELSKN